MSSQKSIETKINFVYDLPYEISEKIFSNLLPVTTLLNCKRVSKSWKQIVENDNIWRSMFQDQKSWKYCNDTETDSWYELYKDRFLLESNWKNGIFTQHKLVDHSSKTSCIIFYKNWILTGSNDGTIKIWDVETFQCLRVFGEPNLVILKQLGIPNIKFLEEFLTEIEVSELVKNANIKFHLDEVSSIDINDKYLVSGSFDGSCIIWKLPDFKPIDRLIIPREISAGLYISNVLIYNDYIVYGGQDGLIGVWKSSLDNFERLQFNLQHCLKAESCIYGICIQNGAIYSREFSTVKSWNIETGQAIQEFQFHDHTVSINCFAVKDQFLFISEHCQLTVWDLQSNKSINILSDKKGPEALFIINNKIISVDDDCTIKIWNLNDLKLFKEFKILDHEQSTLRALSIGGDSKRLAAFTMDDDVVFYDFTENLRKKYLKYL